MAKVIQLALEKERRKRCKQELIAEWFDHYRAAVLRYTRRLLPAHLCPEDVVQEVYTRVLRHKDVESVNNPQAYLIRSARNTIIDILRKQRTSEAAAHKQDSPLSEDFLALDHCELSTAIERSIAALPEKYRDVFIMQRYLGLKTGEIALRMNISERSVQKYQVKILAHFYEELV